MKGWVPYVVAMLLVLAWTDREVALRWTQIFTGPEIIQSYLQAEPPTAAKQAQV